MIDSHCHLADQKFASDLPEVLVRAREGGVRAMIAIADSLPEGEKCLEIASQHADVFCTAGVHPHHAKEWREGDEDRLRQLLGSSAKMRALGEIGLDYHYDFSPRDVQRRVFQTQLSLANTLGLRTVVHCREAVEDLWSIISEVAPSRLVLHCCTERWEDVSRFIGRGDFLSFTGIATYASAAEIRRTIERCPLHRIMIETDAPYLAPVPHRGKRNEPAFVVEVARCIAQVKGIPLEEVERATDRNAVEFFGLPEELLRL